jgi:hypothetical protein
LFKRIEGEKANVKNARDSCEMRSRPCHEGSLEIDSLGHGQVTQKHAILRDDERGGIRRLWSNDILHAPPGSRFKNERGVFRLYCRGKGGTRGSAKWEIVHRPPRGSRTSSAEIICWFLLFGITKP